MTILASPVRSRDIDRFSSLGLRDAAAAVFIVDPASPVEIPAAWLMDAFGLSQAEARVALCAASGAPAPELALRLNLSTNPIKSHLRRIFDKTGASRQSDLAAILASVALVGQGHSAARQNSKRNPD